MDKLKIIQTTAPVLQNADFTNKFYLYCDASNVGVGAVLIQFKLRRVQRNYIVTERECLAVILAIEKFRCYLELQEFQIVTNHSSLLRLVRPKNVSGRIARCIFRLKYKFSFSYRKGKDHIVPLSIS